MILWIWLFRNLDLSNVIIEIDVKRIIDLISESENCLNEFGTYLNDIDFHSYNRDIIYVYFFSSWLW